MKFEISESFTLFLVEEAVGSTLKSHTSSSKIKNRTAILPTEVFISSLFFSIKQAVYFIYPIFLELTDKYLFYAQKGMTGLQCIPSTTYRIIFLSFSIMRSP